MVAMLLVFILSMMCTTVIADNKGTSGLFSYNIKGNGTAEITGFDWDGNKGPVYVPTMIDGYTVTSIAKNAFSTTKTYETGVEVTLPSTITSIGDFAFMTAPITIINIPSSISYIGKGAFASCYLLESFNVAPDQNTYTALNGALYNKTTKELICYPYKLMSGDVIIPKGIKSIGDYACYGGYSITKYSDGSGYGHKEKISYIEIPDSVTSIGEYAFYGWKIETLWLKHDLDHIGTMAFGEVYFNKSVDFGNVKEIDEYAFFNCHIYFNGHENITISSTIIGDYAFTMSSQKGNFDHIYLSKALTSVGKYAFEKKTLRSIPDLTKCTVIGEAAFKDATFQEDEYGRYNGNQVTINCNIPEEAFSGLSASGISFVVNSKEILESAFAGCEIKKITLSDKLITIGDNAFAGCKIKDNSITLTSSVKSIGEGAFDKGLTIYVEAGTYAEMWCRDNGMSYQYVGGNDTSWLNN